MNNPEQSLLKTSIDNLFVMCVEKFDRCSVMCTKLLQFFATFAVVYCIMWFMLPQVFMHFYSTSVMYISASEFLSPLTTDRIIATIIIRGV